MSCDPESYTGNLDVASLVKIAKGRQPSAMVLYSKSKSYCAVNENNLFNPLYTMFNATLSSMIENELQREPVGIPADGIIRAVNNSTGAGNNTNAGQSGRSPTTAVAMIILYSITGIITAMFLLIIVIGAVRAHRHPERYGPRNTAGITRQSRARGIGRAALEALPIFKFGDQEGGKPVQPTGPPGSRDHPEARDIELGAANPENPPPKAPDEPQRHPADAATPEPSSLETLSDPPQPDMVKTVSASATAPQSDTAHPTPEANAENGLACSVCTDEFVRGQDVRVLPCDHKFHPECIDPWLLNVSGTCPMCRVDLRPTTSQGGNGDETTDGTNAERDEPLASSGATEPAATLAPPSVHAADAERRGSRQRLSALIPHLLNRGRMRDATPEERIEALRRYRTARAEQQNGTDSPSGEANTRRNSRWSRVFGGSDTSRRGSYAG